MQHINSRSAQIAADATIELRQELLDAVIELDEKTEALTGCTDRFCYITGRRTGMVTNGGCRCLHNPSQQQLHALMKRAHWISDFRDKVLKLSGGEE